MQTLLSFVLGSSQVWPKLGSLFQDQARWQKLHSPYLTPGNTFLLGRTIYFKIFIFHFKFQGSALYLGIGFGPKALESSQAKDSFYFITFDGSCIRLCRSWSCPFASSPFYGNTLVIIKSNLKCSRAVLKIICGISHASLWAIFVIVICVQAASSSVRGLQLGWQQMPCRQPHATTELGWGQHGSSATGLWVLGLDKANSSCPINSLKSSQTRYPGLSPHPAVVHSGKLAGLGKRCSTSWALGPLLFNPARKGYSLLFWAEGRACSSIPTC